MELYRAAALTAASLLVIVYSNKCPDTCCSSETSKFQIQEDKCILTRNTQRLIADIVKEMGKSERNVFISPFSVVNILQLLLLGSSGDTKVMLSHALSSGTRDIHNTSKCISDEVMLTTGSNLNYTNDFFVSNEYKGLFDSFKKNAYKYYHAAFYNARFSKKPEKARHRINYIVEQKSKGFIKNLFGPGQIASNTKVVIVNTVTFKSQWKHKFDSTKTAERYFHTDSDTKTMTSFMEVTENIQHEWLTMSGDNDETYSLLAVDLPYEDKSEDISKYGMLAIKFVGNTKYDDLSKIESYVANQGILAVRTMLKESPIELHFPKFKMEYERDLGEVLTPSTDLGYVFSSRANYSEFSENLSISSIVHKAAIEVNEEGSTATGASGASFIIRELQSQIFDSPFVFYIYHSCDGLVLFQGRYVYPPNS